MDTRAKVISTLDQAEEIAARLRGEGRGLVLAAGGFDVLQAAHARFLGGLRSDGRALLVVVYDDASLEKPVLSQNARAQLVAALGVVDHVLVWPRASLESLVDRLRPSRVEHAGPGERNIIGEVLDRHR